MVKERRPQDNTPIENDLREMGRRRRLVYKTDKEREEAKLESQAKYQKSPKGIRVRKDYYENTGRDYMADYYRENRNRMLENSDRSYRKYGKFARIIRNYNIKELQSDYDRRVRENEKRIERQEKINKKFSGPGYERKTFPKLLGTYKIETQIDRYESAADKLGAEKLKKLESEKK